MPKLGALREARAPRKVPQRQPRRRRKQRLSGKQLRTWECKACPLLCCQVVLCLAECGKYILFDSPAVIANAKGTSTHTGGAQHINFIGGSCGYPWPLDIAFIALANVVWMPESDAGSAVMCADGAVQKEEQEGQGQEKEKPKTQIEAPLGALLSSGDFLFRVQTAQAPCLLLDRSLLMQCATCKHSPATARWSPRGCRQGHLGGHRAILSSCRTCPACSGAVP